MTIAGENEKDELTQARTDAGHGKQAQSVAKITGREVRQWKPQPDQGKDLADCNAREAEASRRAEKLKQQLSRGWGHDDRQRGR